MDQMVNQWGGFHRLISFVFSISYSCSQLFGEEDADQDVSPDMADPEAACECDTQWNVVYEHGWTDVVSLGAVNREPQRDGCWELGRRKGWRHQASQHQRLGLLHQIRPREALQQGTSQRLESLVELCEEEWAKDSWSATSPACL